MISHDFQGSSPNICPWAHSGNSKPTDPVEASVGPAAPRIENQSSPQESPVPKIPDILNLEPQLSLDNDAIHALLELAFMGKEAAKGLDKQLGILDKIGYGWNLDLFAEDLFVRELIQKGFTIAIGGVRFPVNQAFLFHVLSDPPTELGAIEFRQAILRELESDTALLDRAKTLYQELSQLLSMFKAPDHAAKLDANAYRLDILRQAKLVIDQMAAGFGDCTSGLRRLGDSGKTLQGSEDYKMLADLLEYEGRMATLDVRLGVGADGEVKHLELVELKENQKNRNYASPWKRLLQRLQLTLFRGYRLGPREIVNRLLQEVFKKVGPTLTPLVQLIGQLEFYLAAVNFRDDAGRQGLAVCLPTFDETRPMSFDRVFNPLLLCEGQAPVPCSVDLRHRHGTTLITGPNSGGKTRLLQTVGLSQLLGQAGLYVPAASANLPRIRGLFVSLVENETSDQAEGRLGRELMRIRHLFESMGTPSMVILDELCSGTNPSEGTDIFLMVLRLLERLDTVAFISTHYLDFAKELKAEPPVEDLEFLRVESREDLTSTYQFVEGVAETSLAAATAERLGVSFEKLAALVDTEESVVESAIDPR